MFGFKIIRESSHNNLKEIIKIQNEILESNEKIIEHQKEYIKNRKEKIKLLEERKKICDDLHKIDMKIIDRKESIIKKLKAKL